jgi:hypothetical protein
MTEQIKALAILAMVLVQWYSIILCPLAQYAVKLFRCLLQILADVRNAVLPHRLNCIVILVWATII